MSRRTSDTDNGEPSWFGGTRPKTCPIPYHGNPTSLHRGMSIRDEPGLREEDWPEWQRIDDDPQTYAEWRRENLGSHGGLDALLVTILEKVTVIPAELLEMEEEAEDGRLALTALQYASEVLAKQTRNRRRNLLISLQHSHRRTSHAAGQDCHPFMAHDHSALTRSSAGRCRPAP